MNDIVAAMGIEGWKPLISALLLPPLPLLLLVLVGARLMFRRRVLAWLTILIGVTLIWLSATTASGKLLRPLLLTLPPPLTAEQIAELKRDAGAAGPRTAIVVMGAGRRSVAPEYGLSTLTPLSMERLRYGIWLARQTGLPLAYSGGIGHGASSGVTEAETAVRIAEREFLLPLRWGEARSRDTSESGLFTVPLLQESGIERIVLVTHDLHQPRALRAFERGAARAGKPMALVPAPMGLQAPYDWNWTDFVPTSTGFVETRMLLHEWLGLLLGA